MSIPQEIEDNFYAGKRSEQIRFTIDDVVKITSGEAQGKEGTVIELESIEPEATYTIELSDGSADVEVTQSNMEMVTASDFHEKH
ncbi:MAG: hypothetical protein EP297_05720 [Gammaproteobacteria bacterium]|nr:MAG: hypothetical protein EP297_05720 [Gammaproteobacteria bacterium]